jgi:uncharacterized membrane protein (Fun14 family)
MNQYNTNVTKGWLEKLKEHLQELTERLDLSLPKLTELGVAFGLGILGGFLVKRFGRQTIVLFVLITAILLGFDYLGVIKIDWLVIKDFIGIAPSQTLEGFVQEYIGWIKEHILAVFVGVIGFLIGYKIG